MKKLLTIVILGLLWSGNVYSSSIECSYEISSYMDSKKGKFKKGKIFDDEKKIKIKVDKIEKLETNNPDKKFQGILNGTDHKNRKVQILQKSEVIQITQTDAYGLNYFAAYIIFMGHKGNNGAYLSSMYSAYPYTLGQTASIYNYLGSCLIKN